MKRFLRFYNKDKQNVKMINQTENGFELVILSDIHLKEILEYIHESEEVGDSIDVIWQMKFKRENFKQYKACSFSAPMDNFHPTDKNVPLGKKIKITCDGTGYYTDSEMLKNRSSRSNRSKILYKDMTLLTRMLKISELNVKSTKN